MLEFRDRYTAELGLKLIVWRNEEALEQGANPIRLGTQRCCGLLKTQALLDGLRAHGFDAAFGGARRDEEKSRAKERIFSFRDSAGQWDPKNQRPELWSLFNGRIGPGESIRVFPLSNWTELDIWHYIAKQQLEIPSIYFAHTRTVFERDGILLADNEFVTRGDDEPLYQARVRYRTVGDMTCTGAVESTAATVDEVITEVAATRITERGQTRADDRASEAAMEDRKREGYF
jgi:sulfate adenylyltransferase subunit 2